ncbi:MAG: hypothetical protein H6838_06785 [Planctomycetes bacterium]|nr:hypothetical protein [Planctomycetota bacterium]
MKGGGIALVLWVVAAAAPLACAQEPIELVVPADQTLRFGEPFEVSVRLSAALREAAFDPAWLQPLLVEQSAPGGADAAGGTLWQCRVRAFAVGEVAIGRALDVTVPPGRAVRAQLLPVTLRVASVLPDPPGDYEWPGDVRELRRGSWWPYALVALAVAMGGALALRGRRAVPVAAPAPPPPVPAHEPVLAGLAALGDELDDLAFHTELVSLLRGYLARRYDLHADVRTSEELWQHHRAGGAELLRDCLWRCDLVKFACIAPPRDERERARQAAIGFVRHTASTTEAA